MSRRVVISTPFHANGFFPRRDRAAEQVGGARNDGDADVTPLR
jgi:hypothetical protein